MLKFLHGVRILDLGRLMPSSIATVELAKLGADVVKVEIPPHGDYLRITPPTIGDRGDMHLEINRCKRSLALRFDQPRGREVLLRMAAAADVVVELSRPGAMERLGLDHAAVRAVNDSVVYCSFSGFGQDGPYAELAAHGLSADAASGFMPLGDIDGRAALPEPYVSVGPRASGLYGAIAILGALFHARSTGEGQYIDVSQWDAAVAWNYRELALTANNGDHTPSYRALGPRYEVYRCADGRHILFAATEAKLWLAFCDAIDRPDLRRYASDDVVEYGENREVRDALTSILATRTRSEWIELGSKTGVPIAPLLTADEVPANEHVLARGMIRREQHPLGGEVLLSGHPVKFEAGEAEFTPAPELGQHSAAVLADFGFEPGEVAELIAEAVVVAFDSVGREG